MHDELLLDEESLQMREHLNRQRAQAVQDLAALCQSPEGRAHLERLLLSLGLGRVLAPDPAMIALRNEALQWVKRIALADPKFCANILMRILREN